MAHPPNKAHAHRRKDSLFMAGIEAASSKSDLHGKIEYTLFELQQPWV
jgi:hypothetical protein